MRPQARRRTVLVVRVLVVVLGAHGTGTVAQEKPRIARVRSENPLMAMAITQGAERSKSLRRVIEAIEATDGIVHVQEGECRRSVRSCLQLWVGVAGKYRLLRILVSLRKAPDCELVASIGHELQHALEVLRNSKIRSTSEMYGFFERIGPTESGTFETDAAKEIGMQVEKEACNFSRSGWREKLPTRPPSDES